MPAPSAPTSFAADETAVLHFFNRKVSNKAAIKFTWTNNAPTTAQHRLEKSIDAGANWTLAGIADVGATSLIIGGLALSTAHQFQLRAEDDGGVSSFAGPVSITTPALATGGAPPTAPGSFANTAVTSYSATFTWEDASTNEAKFEIEVTRGSTVRSFYVEGLVETATLDLQAVFGSSTASVAGAIFSARCRALGGKASAASFPGVASAWSAPVAFTLAAPSVRITSPRTLAGEIGVAIGTYTLATNVPCTIFAATKTITSSSVANPSVITCPGHNKETGDVVTIAGHTGSTPDINGSHTITRTGLNTFTIPVDVTVGGTGGTISPALPPGLALTGNVIDGTPTMAGNFTVDLTAGDGATSDTISLAIAIAQSRVRFTSAATARGSVGVAFSFQLRALPAGVTFSATNLPAWMALETIGGVTRLTGTPDEEGIFELQLAGESGGSSNTQVLTVTIDPVALLGSTTLSAAIGQEFRLLLSALPSGCVFTADDLPGWLTLTEEGLLSGTPTVEAVHEFDITASYGPSGVSVTYTLTVRPIFTIATSIEGKLGQYVLAYVSYDGAGVVSQWWIGNAPAGLELWDYALPEDSPLAGYGLGVIETSRRVIRGFPVESGPFVATISLECLRDNGFETHAIDVPIRITGGLYVAWFHVSPTLYDLQISLRGDGTRRVRSYYGRDATPASVTQQTVGDTVITTQNAASAGNVLTVIRGDSSPRLGILIRDGLDVVGSGTKEITSSSAADPSVIICPGHGRVTGSSATIAGHSGSTPDINGTHVITVLDADTFTIPVNVTAGGTGGRIDDVGGIITGLRFTLRKADAEDGEYLFDLPGVATITGEHSFYLVEFEVDHEEIDELLDDPSLGTLGLLGQISFRYNGELITAPTFLVTVIEDIRREES